VITLCTARNLRRLSVADAIALLAGCTRHFDAESGGYEFTSPGGVSYTLTGDASAVSAVLKATAK
jgi:hypothetical protein